MNLTKKQISELSKVFKKYNVQFAYLFGSQATGKANRKSDFDFAVMLPEKINKNKRFNVRLKLMAETGKISKTFDNTDVVILNDINSILFNSS